jgi:hypothetical protein
MKVKELIEQLQKFDPEQIVVVDGYETGYDEVKKLYHIAGLSKLPDDKAYYDGEYQKADCSGEENELVSAVYIPRSS